MNPTPAPIPCRRLKDKYVIVRISEMRYRIGELVQDGNGFNQGFTNLRQVSFDAEYLRDLMPLSYGQLLNFLVANEWLTTPDVFQPKEP